MGQFYVRQELDLATWGRPPFLFRWRILRLFRIGRPGTKGGTRIDPVLRKVGESVETFFRDFPNTSSVERVRRERWRTTGDLEVRVDEKYNYLLLARAQDGAIGLEEDRDGASGESVKWKKCPAFHS